MRTWNVAWSRRECSRRDGDELGDAAGEAGDIALDVVEVPLGHLQGGLDDGPDAVVAAGGEGRQGGVERVGGGDEGGAGLRGLEGGRGALGDGGRADVYGVADEDDAAAVPG